VPYADALLFSAEIFPALFSKTQHWSIQQPTVSS